MGCVLGTRATPDRRSKSNARLRSVAESTTTQPKQNVEQVPLDEVRDDKKDGVVGRIRQTGSEVRLSDRRRPRPEYSLKTAQGWPSWLSAVAGDAIKDWTPRRANTFEKLDKIGQGTYSNVYKARDLITGKIVALKKVRFDNLEPESVKFMAREILILKKLNHPNIIKLEGLVTSRMSCSLYLVFEYMEHDLSGLAAVQGVKFTEPQIKCFIKQLLSGLEHCHENGVLHRDIKGSNLLIDNDGILKIADFGLASLYDPQHKQPMTSRVVTLWYRPPELLLGATYYGVGVDLWSAGCILAELLAGKPIMPGRTEHPLYGIVLAFFLLLILWRLYQAQKVEQLHKIFKLCGSPSEEYWKRSRLPNATLFKPQQPYKRCTAETFKDFPPSSLPLLESLLSIDPDLRGTAVASLNSERWRVVTQANAKSKSEKFPPPHRDAAVGYPLDPSQNSVPVSFSAAEDTSFSSSIFDSNSSRSVKEGGPSRRKNRRERSRKVSSRKFIRAFLPTSISLSMDLRFKSKEAVRRNRR
ncbi:Protein kinase, ATP binding site-containing protein [Cynara cardunculus var. scolymus]|uniref:Protein kinase, ATP binding site-containing protein n=1 Tax=Cynara cardunculus var. scolymus TaxID=59895 RepID=A0A103YBS2_CYNCS|nr:Protein kinase, ATP binding site-containing protein [Cynara cardunculus var. scolymus]